MKKTPTKKQWPVDQCPIGWTPKNWYKRCKRVARLCAKNNPENSGYYRAAEKRAQETGALLIVLDDPRPTPEDDGPMVISRDDAMDFPTHKKRVAAAEAAGVPYRIADE